MLSMEMQRAKRSMDTLTVTLKMRQKELQEQGEEEDTTYEDQKQINWGVRAWADNWDVQEEKSIQSQQKREYSNDHRQEGMTMLYGRE